MNSFNTTPSATSDEVRQPSQESAAIPQTPSAVTTDVGQTAAEHAEDEGEDLEPGALSPVQKEARCYCW